MFENLLQLIKENAGDAIINNPAIPNEKNDAAISAAGEGIMEQLKGAMSGGGAQGIMEMFSGGNPSSSPMVGQISNSVAQSLMSKFGIDSGQAGNIVQSLIPTVMNKLVHKTNDPNDSSFDIQGIMNSLGGGGGIMDNLKKLF